MCLSGNTAHERGQDTSPFIGNKKRATAGHRQGDGKRALAKQSIIRETFESDGFGPAFSIAESRFSRSVSKGGWLKRLTRECEVEEERERERERKREREREGSGERGRNRE